MKNSDKLKHLERFEEMKRRGQSVPFLEYVPEVDPYHYWVWKGFLTLTAQRWTGHEGTPQPIAVSEIKAYAEYVGMADESDREDFLDIILALDDIALSFTRQKISQNREKQMKESKKKGPSARGGRRR